MLLFATRQEFDEFVSVCVLFEKFVNVWCVCEWVGVFVCEPNHKYRIANDLIVSTIISLKSDTSSSDQ